MVDEEQVQTRAAKYNLREHRRFPTGHGVSIQLPARSRTLTVGRDLVRWEGKVPRLEAQGTVHVQEGAAGRAALHVKVARLVAQGLLRLLFRVRVYGLEHVPRGPVIVCANHLGWADPFLILALLPVEPRLYVLGERAGVLRSAFRIRVIGALQVMVPLERDKPREALRIMQGVLERGGSLIIFPEGELGTQEGALQPLQHGAAQLSVHSGVPLLPVGVTGTAELWLRRPITVRVGCPIDPAAITEGDARSRIRALTAALDAALCALLPGDCAHPRRKPLRDRLTNLL
jgi:1-acyl-sn-glycerol-3-phosphate acyltransferase